MKIQLHKSHLVLLIGSVILFALLYFAGYYLYLKPLNDTVHSIEKSNTLLQKKIDEPVKNVDKTEINFYSLLQKVPVDSQIEQFVLDLEKAEIISNSIIQSIEFTEGDIVLQEPGVVEDEDDENTTELLEEDEVEKNEKVVEIPGAPEGLEQLSVHVRVISDNFYDIKKFVDVIEQQKRITMVNQLTFSGPPEMTQITDVDYNYEYEIHLTAFYLPTLTELLDEAPKIDRPQPSGKNNPFNRTFSGDNDE